jgi:hypothetical protein
MTAPLGLLVDSNSTPLPNVGISVDTSGVPTVQTRDSSGNQVSTPVGGSGSTPASGISPKAASTGAVGTSAAYARQDHAHPVNDGIDIGLINATQKTQIAGGATTALLNAAKTALKDPAGGADVTLGVSTFAGLGDKVSADIAGTNTSVSTGLANKMPKPTAWAASGAGGTPTLTSGTAVLGTSFVNTTPGTTTLSPNIDGIGSVNQWDELVCLTAGTYTLSPALDAAGRMAAAQFPILAGDVTTAGSSLTTTLSATAPVLSQQATNAQSGTTYTLVLADAGNNVDMSNASANTCFVPANSLVPMPIGTVVSVTMAGAGITTIAPSVAAETVTINKPAARSLSISAQLETALLQKVGTNTWRAWVN